MRNVPIAPMRRYVQRAGRTVTHAFAVEGDDAPDLRSVCGRSEWLRSRPSSGPNQPPRCKYCVRLVAWQVTNLGCIAGWNEWEGSDEEAQRRRDECWRRRHDRNVRLSADQFISAGIDFEAWYALT